MNSDSQDVNRAASAQSTERSGAAKIGLVVGAVVLITIVVGLLLSAFRSPGIPKYGGRYLRSVGEALSQYANIERAFPAAAIQDTAGNSILSWRVILLPYIERNDLARAIHRDEPWNGRNNEPLIAREPHVYQSAYFNGQNLGETDVLAIVGPDTVLMPNRGARLDEITDGASNTIIAVELIGGGIAWSEPRDVSIDEFIAAIQRTPSDTGLRPRLPGGAACLFADGSVRFIPSDTPPEDLRGMCTRAGGEQVNLPPL